MSRKPAADDIERIRRHLRDTRGVTWWGTPDGRVHTAIVSETWFDLDADGEPVERHELRHTPPICGACATPWPCDVFAREAARA